MGHVQAKLIELPSLRGMKEVGMRLLSPHRRAPRDLCKEQIERTARQADSGIRRRDSRCWFHGRCGDKSRAGSPKPKQFEEFPASFLNFYQSAQTRRAYAWGQSVRRAHGSCRRDAIRAWKVLLHGFGARPERRVHPAMQRWRDRAREAHSVLLRIPPAPR